MNVRPNLAPGDRPIALSAIFNQDNSCFSVGYEGGFHIYSTDPCELHVTRDLKGGISQAAMLNRANYLALAGGGRSPKYAQNKVIIYDDATQRAISSIPLKSLIRSVRLSYTRIVVVLHSQVHVYTFEAHPTLLHVFETHDNPLGLVAMSPKTLAFPGRTPGHVQLCDLKTGNISIIPAHSSPLAAITLSPKGDLIATASEKGTIIRVYSVDNCRPVTELRRGIDKAAIYSLSITPSSSLLAVTSDKNTLHVFSLRTPTPDAGTSNNRRWSLLGKLPLLPSYFSSEFSAASCEFSGGGWANCGWTGEDSVVVVSVGDSGGKKGGEPRWEKFVLVEAVGGQGMELVREGWRRYLDND